MRHLIFSTLLILGFLTSFVEPGLWSSKPLAPLPEGGCIHACSESGDTSCKACCLKRNYTAGKCTSKDKKVDLKLRPCGCTGYKKPPPPPPPPKKGASSKGSKGKQQQGRPRK